MVRKEVKLGFIENESARKVTFEKGVKEIMKKAEELSVLHDVDVCVVIYSQYSKEPVTWPSNQAEARRISLEFKRKMDEYSDKKLNQESYIRESMHKAMDKILEMQMKKRELQMENLAVEILGGRPMKSVPFSDFPDLIWVMRKKLRAVQKELGNCDNIPVNDMADAPTGAIPNLNLVYPNAQMGEAVPLEKKPGRTQ